MSGNLLDILAQEGQATGLKWIMRYSTTGRGLRLHQSPNQGVYDTPEEAIKAWIKQNNIKSI